MEHLYRYKNTQRSRDPSLCCKKERASFGKGVLMQSKEPVMPCKPEASQRDGIANRLLSLRAIWKLSVVELVFWVMAIGIAVFRTLYWA